MKQVAGYMERKSMLYRTEVEYGDFAMNHVLGCAHGCKYPCYAFLGKKRWRKIKDYSTSNVLAKRRTRMNGEDDEIDEVELKKKIRSYAKEKFNMMCYIMNVYIA